MKLKLFVLFSFVLMVAASGFAATPKKYCFRTQNVGYTEGGGTIYYLHLSKEDPSQNSWYYDKCFDAWYNESGEHYDEGEQPLDALTYLNYTLQNGWASAFLLDDDYDFGGLAASGEKCVGDFYPVDISGVDFDGQGHTLKGLCHIITVDSDNGGNAVNLGFFASASGSSLKNVVFDNAYFKVKSFEPDYSYSSSNVGVLLGYGNSMKSISNVTVKNSKVSGVVAGGVVGKLENSQAVEKVSLENVTVSMDAGSVTADAQNVRAEIGGVLGKAEYGLFLKDAALNSVVVKLDAGVDSAYVGGLVGRASFAETYHTIANNYSVNASIQSSCTNNEKCHAGFVSGMLDKGSVYGFYFYANYYVGDDNLAADLTPIMKTGYTSDTWKNYSNGKFNYRNATKGLTATANFDKDVYCFYTDEEHAYADSNGVVEANFMKTDLFAAVMNRADYNMRHYGKVNNAWSRKDGVNGGYPVFATSSLLPIYQVSFSWNSGSITLSEEDKAIWSKNGASGNFVKVVNDYTGKVTSNKEWMTYVAKVSASKDYYWDYYNEQTSKQTSENFSENTVLKRSAAYELKKQSAFVVAYRRCTNNSDLQTCTVVGTDNLFTTQPITSYGSGNSWAVVPSLMVSSKVGEEIQWEKLRPVVKVNVCDAEDANCTLSDGLDGALFKTVATSALNMANASAKVHDTLYVMYGVTLNDNDVVYIADVYGFGSDGPFKNLYVKAYDYNKEGVLEEQGEYSGFPIGTSTSMMPLYNVEDVNDVESVPYAPEYSITYDAKAGTTIDSVLAIVLATKGGGTHAQVRLRNLRYDFLDWIPVKDTVLKLDDADVIAAEMTTMNNSDVRYVRYMKMPNGGRVDVSNIYAAIDYLSYGDTILLATKPVINYIDYVVSFDYSLDGVDLSKVFIGDSLMDDSWLVRKYNVGMTNQYDAVAPYDIYRTDACIAADWLPTLVSGYEGTSIQRIGSLFDETFLKSSFVKKVSDLEYTLKLYATWNKSFENCKRYVNKDRLTRKILIDAEHGSFTLVQKWTIGGKEVILKHDAECEDGECFLEIPNSDGDFTFQVLAKPDPGFSLDGKIKFNGGSGYETREIEEGGDVQITSAKYENPTLSANFNYAMTIATEMGDTKVFYGKDSKQKAMYKLTSASEEIPSDEPQEAPVEGLDGPGEAEVTPPSVPLPKWVYTSDSCVVGWKITTKEGYDFDPITDFNEDVAEMLIELQGKQEVYKIYPVWASAEKCVADYGYNQVSLGLDDGGKVENGTIVFDEDVLDDAGKKVSVATHEFGSANKMLLPAYMEGKELMVRSAPEEGFAVDSIVMVQADKKIVVLEEEGKLSGRLAGARFWATFFPLDTTPMEFVEDTLYVSGNAVKLTFTTTAFDVRAKAEVRVNLFDALGNVIVKDSLLVKEIQKTPYKGEWEKYPLYAGSYLLRVTMTNRWRGSFVYEQDFEIADKILAVEKDSWQMVSLNQVDFSKFAWDTSDVRFYWWDESSDFGEFWQYQRLENEKGVTADNRGYWYSSMKGTNLNLKSKQPEKIDGSWALDSVYSGWNMVANPYSWYVEVCALDEAACGEDGKKPEVEFYNWNAETNTYEEAKYVKPYGAVWAKVSKPVTWNLPKVPSYIDVVSAEGDTKEAAASDLKKVRSTEKAVSKSSWSMQANLRDASGKRRSWNLLGVSSEGWNSEVPPAGMGDQVSFAVVDGKKSFIKSFKKASADDTYEWNVELNASSDREGYLSFAGVKALNEMGLRVYVTIDGNTTEMKEDQDVGVLLKKAATSATVRVAASPAKTLVYQLNGLRALKVGSGLQVYFNASEGLAGSTTRVNLMDLNGKVLSSAVTKTAQGTNMLELAAPRSGLYIVNVKAGNKQQSGQILVK